MRVLILGASGMLGHKLTQTLGQRFETWATVRSPAVGYARYSILDPARLIDRVDAADFDSVVRAFKAARPDVVVNAVGIVRQLPEARDPVISLTGNSLVPHRVAQLCDASGARLLHVSTDCVFAGRKGCYTEDDPPDAEDLYGRSKLLGEVGAPHLTIRTSMVGRKLATRHGLLEWFLSNRGRQVRGYTRAIFSGFPTVVLASLLGDLIERHAGLSGLYHVSAEPIDKHRLLCLWRDAYDLPIEIEPFENAREDRSLDSSRFRAETGFRPPTWPELVATMARDPTPYDEWRQRVG